MDGCALSRGRARTKGQRLCPFAKHETNARLSSDELPRTRLKRRLTSSRIDLSSRLRDNDGQEPSTCRPQKKHKTIHITMQSL